MPLVLFYHHVWLFLSHLCYLLVYFIFYLSSKIISIFLATPPNAMIFSSGSVRIIEMVKVGFVVKLIGIAVILLASMTILSPIFRIHQVAAVLNASSLLNNSISG